MESCLYEGWVRHRRHEPTEHAFRYPLYLAWLDLDEIAGLSSCGLLGRSRWSPAAFLREDHFGEPGQPLGEAVADEVERSAGERPAGPIRLLTFLRNWGYYFSPLNLFFCFTSDGRQVRWAVAEVSNTPWLERTLYVLPFAEREGGQRTLRAENAKTFHVSPFLGMDYTYRWTVAPPGERAAVRIENWRAGRRDFEASLTLRRVDLNRAAWTRLLLSYPWMSLATVAGIYWEALHLWIKQCPYFPHPNAGPPSNSPPSNPSPTPESRVGSNPGAEMASSSG